MQPPSCALLSWNSSLCLRCSLKRQLRPPPRRSIQSSTRNTQYEAFKRIRSLPKHISRQRPNTSKSTVPHRTAQQGIRSRLREWAASSEYQPLNVPFEHIDIDGVLNNLTRPEDVAVNDSTKRFADVNEMDDAEMELEDLGEFVGNLDRIAVQFENLASAQRPRIARGDLVALSSSSNSPSYCVFLGYSDTGYYQYYSVEGKLEFRSSWTHIFHSPGLVPFKDVEPLLPYLPRGVDNLADLDIPVAAQNVPRDLASPLLHKLVRFREDAEHVLRRLSPTLARAHSLLAHPTDIRWMTLEEIADELTKHVDVGLELRSPPALYALNLALLKQVFGFFHLNFATYASDRYVLIFSYQTMVSIYRVQRWVRAYQEEAALTAGGLEGPRELKFRASIFRGFVRKSQHLIEQGCALRQATPHGEPLSAGRRGTSTSENSEAITSSLGFTDWDRDFIKLIALVGVTNAFMFHPTLSLLLQLILRTVGRYTDVEIPDHAARSFLIDIGVFNHYDHTKAFDLYGWPSCHDLTADLARAQAKINSGASAGDVAVLRDSMKHFRKDWGNMPVFCIDPPGTVEVDDGISLEPVPGSPGHAWIHTHIAHISAYTSPDHLLGRAAQHAQMTLYLSSMRIPMLPSWASAVFSLSPGSAVLTFSAKLDQDCNVLETMVQPGIIHNIVTTSAEVVDKEVFSFTPALRHLMSLRVGETLDDPDVTAAKEMTPLTEEHKKALKDLYEISRKLSKNSLVESSDAQSYKLGLNVQRKTSSPLVSAIDLAPSHAQFDTRNPLVEINVEQQMNMLQIKPSRTLVEQAMLLAGRVAGEYARERDIPLIFVGTQPAADGVEVTSPWLRKQLRTSDRPKAVFAHIARLFAATMYSSTPVQHSFLGSTAWVRVTSPLRKFMDLVCHWQIDASLREEHRMGVSLAGTGKVSHLPYQKPDIEKTMLLCNAREQASKVYGRGDTRHWILHAIGRAFYFNEASLPDPLLCEVIETQRSSSSVPRGKITAFDTNCAFSTENGEDGNIVQAGETWETRIDYINFAAQTIFVVPVRKARAARRADAYNDGKLEPALSKDSPL